MDHTGVNVTWAITLKVALVQVTYTFGQ